MGRTIEIECTAKVFIDEYVGKVSDEALMDETISRLDGYGGKIKNHFFKELMDYDENLMIDAISESKNLSIIEADKLKEFLTNLG